MSWKRNCMKSLWEHRCSLPDCQGCIAYVTKVQSGNKKRDGQSLKSFWQCFPRRGEESRARERYGKGNFEEHEESTARWFGARNGRRTGGHGVCFGYGWIEVSAIREDWQTMELVPAQYCAECNKDNPERCAQHFWGRQAHWKWWKVKCAARYPVDPEGAARKPSGFVMSEFLY